MAIQGHRADPSRRVRLPFVRELIDYPEYYCHPGPLTAQAGWAAEVTLFAERVGHRHSGGV